MDNHGQLKQIFALADVNSMYVSCELVFRPDLCKNAGRCEVLWDEKNAGHPNYIPDHTLYWKQATLEPFCDAKCGLEFTIK